MQTTPPPQKVIRYYVEWQQADGSWKREPPGYLESEHAYLYAAAMRMTNHDQEYRVRPYEEEQTP